MNKNVEEEYADVYWSIDDLCEYDIPKYRKKELMEEMEEDLRDRMIEKGWEFIYNYMEEHGYKKKEN